MIGNYIKAVAGGTSISTATLMKTGQTTSYRTGDDGDLQAGRNVDFFTLAENNVFGTTDRFTDELGTQVYANNIVIDWSTYDGSEVLGWYRIRGTYTDVSWNDAIDNSLLFSIGSFTNGWRLPNITEFMSLFSIADLNPLTRPLGYPPFDTLPSGYYWTSTTAPNSTTSAYIINNQFLTSPNFISVRVKTNTSISYRAIPCRTFTVTGTTLS